MFTHAISEKDKRLLAEGEAQGWAQGNLEFYRKMASKMKADDMAPELIQKYTGLSLEDIARLEPLTE